MRMQLTEEMIAVRTQNQTGTLLVFKQGTISKTANYEYSMWVSQETKMLA